GYRLLTTALLHIRIRQPPPTSPLFPYTTLFRSSQDRYPDPGPLQRGRPARRRARPRLAAGEELHRPDQGARHGLGPHPRRLRGRSEEHTSELQSLAYLVCRLLLEKKKTHGHRIH